jgi:hypothetical protein
MQIREENIRHDFKLFLAVFTLLLIFIMSARSPLDADMWWHLRAGEQSVQQQSPLVEDLFSFTRMGQLWVNHSWLSQIIIYMLYKFFGFWGLSAFVSICAVFSFYFVQKQMEESGMLKAFLIVLGGITASYTWSPRPQMISQILLAFLGYYLFSLNSKKRSVTWFLPFLFIVWGNLHGGYVIGFMFIACFILGESLNYLFSSDHHLLLEKKDIISITIFTVISFLLVVVNPNGIQTWLVPFKTVSLLSGISEWNSPDFHDLGQQSMLWILFGILAVFYFSPKNKDAKELLIILVFGYSAFMYRRNFGFFALVAIPVLGRHLEPCLETAAQKVKAMIILWKPEWGKKYLDKKERAGATPIFPKIINLCLIGFLGATAMLKIGFVASPLLLDSVIPSLYPEKGVEFIKLNHLENNLLNEYDWGGYLIWNLRSYPVFIDGRADLYDNQIIHQWQDLLQVNGDWQKILTDWDIHTVFIKPERPLTRSLIDQGWKVLYQDELCIILESNYP